MWIFLSLACSPESPQPPVPAPEWTPTVPVPTVPSTPVTGPPCAWAEACVDLTDAPRAWTLDDGWTFSSGVSVADLTGDGTADVWASATEPAGGARVRWILDGAALASLHLPSDAYASTAEFATPIPDISGDGLADLHLAGSLVPGPFPRGEIDGGAALGSVLGIIAEVDGDGVGDLLFDESHQLRIWSGPYATPAGAADRVVAPPCTPDGNEPLFGAVYPDVTGDGAAELYLSGSFGYDSCGGWTVSAGFVGELDPTTTDAVWDASRPLDVIGDQDGDGFREVWSGVDVWRGPLTFLDGEVSHSGLVAADAQVAPGTLVRLPGDLDADGFGDFVVAEYLPENDLTTGPVVSLTLTVVAGGFSDAVFGARRLARYGFVALDPRWFATVAPIGRVDHLLLFVWDGTEGGVVAADLGPAVAIDPAD